MIENVCWPLTLPSTCTRCHSPITTGLDNHDPVSHWVD